MADVLDTVLGKAVAILRAYTAEDTELSLAELVRRTGLSKGSAHRVAGDLVEHGLMERTRGGYRLSVGLFELGMLATTERTLLELATPFLQDLYERTHETVHLGVLDDDAVVYLVKIGGHRQARSPSRAGGRMPLHCTAIGKTLLAHAGRELQQRVLAGPLERRTSRTVVAPGLLRKQLRTIRERGVGYEREESAPGLLCVAAPVFDADGRTPIAAVSITGRVGRFRPEAHETAVRAAAAALGSTLARRATG